MASAVAALGLAGGQSVATLAWNGYRHMEIYHAVSALDAVPHPLDPRLHPDQLVRIADDAQDQILFFDLTFLPLVEAIAPRVKTIKTFVAMTDRAHMPPSSMPANLLCYEDLLESASADFASQELVENAAALTNVLNCSARDTILLTVPMFDADARGLPHAACMAGAKLVFPGPFLDGRNLYELFETEGVTLSACAPAVWEALLAHVEAGNLRFSSMRRTVIGGDACPPDMVRALEERYGVSVLHARGMAEQSTPGIDLKP